jgi:ComF family protein
MTLFDILKPIAQTVLDTLLPPQCLGCDTPVARDGQFCALCFAQVNFITRPFCASCGVPFASSAGMGQGGICQVCEAAPPAFAQARAALHYDRMAKDLILPFKYADRTELARGLALLMAKAGAALLSRASVLIPVPLHISRLRQRRYNQSALLAAALSRIAGKPLLPDALIRTRATAPLGPLGFDARQEQLKDAIRARSMIVSGQSVLLIDDVMTSGTTANACALALRQAGASRVDVLTAARVPDPRLS